LGVVVTFRLDEWVLAAVLAVLDVPALDELLPEEPHPANAASAAHAASVGRRVLICGSTLA
jgi:hypothetical protein